MAQLEALLVGVSAVHLALALAASLVVSAALALAVRGAAAKRAASARVAVIHAIGTNVPMTQAGGEYFLKLVSPTLA